MAYLDRLIEDSGLRFTRGSASPVGGHPAADESAPSAFLEAEQTLVLAAPTAAAAPQPAPPSASLKPSQAAVAGPASPDAGASPVAAAPPAQVTSETLTTVPQAGQAATAVPTASAPSATAAAIQYRPEQTDLPTPVFEPSATSPLPPREPPTESSQERLVHTLALVREWTAATPAPEEVPLQSSRPRSAAGGQDAAVVAEPGSATLEQVSYATKHRRPASPEMSPVAQPLMRGASERVSEPEVVNVSLSVGSIELTLEAPPGPAAPPPAQAAPDQRPAPADSASLLRRHYFRPSIRW